MRRLVAALAAIGIAMVLLPSMASAAENVPVAEWVNGVCGTLSDWRDEVRREADDFEGNVSSNSSVSEVKGEFVHFLDDVVAATQSMRSDVRALGTPDVRQGSGIASTMRNGLGKVQKGLEDARTRAEDLPTSSRAKFTSQLESIAAALDKSSSAAGDVFDSAKKKYDTKELDAAEKKSRACKGLS